MKAKTKKRLDELSGQISTMREELAEILAEEEEAFESKSDKWRESDKGQQQEQGITSLQVAIDGLDNAQSEIDAVVSSSE